MKRGLARRIIARMRNMMGVGRALLKRRGRAAQRAALIDQINKGARSCFLYYGNLGVCERQYAELDVLGLALYPRHEREMEHDACKPLPFAAASINRIQSQDVFEHIAKEHIPGILDEIYRVLRPGGVFRLSVPDYRSPLLKKRSVYDSHGSVIADLMMGAGVSYDAASASVLVEFGRDGNAHLWFPTWEQMHELVACSRISRCSEIRFYHGFEDDEHFRCEPFPDLGMPVNRAPPFDMRAHGAPISIIVDFIK